MPIHILMLIAMPVSIPARGLHMSLLSQLDGIHLAPPPDLLPDSVQEPGAATLWYVGCVCLFPSSYPCHHRVHLTQKFLEAASVS